MKLSFLEDVFPKSTPPSPRCHASSICLAPYGMACAWFGGQFEGARETAIWWSLRHGDSWSTPFLAADIGPEPHWNPVLHFEDKTLYLFFKVGIYPKRWRTYMTKYDHDRGLWSPAKILVDGDSGGRGPVKNKIIVLADGTWLAPASLERDEGWDCFVDRSTDRGSTWRSSELVPIDRSALKGPGIIQPTLWQSAPNSIHMLARSVEGWIYRSDSCDNGLSWCRAYPITVPNNNSGLDLAKLDDGSLVLACNPVSEPGLRTPLCLFLSNDNGLHWELAFTLEDDPGEFSYPAIVQMKGGFGLSYTDRRIGIRYGQFIMKDMAIGGPRGSRR